MQLNGSHFPSGMKYDNVSALLKELDTITNNYHGFTHTKDNNTGKLQVFTGLTAGEFRGITTGVFGGITTGE